MGERGQDCPNLGISFAIIKDIIGYKKTLLGTIGHYWVHTTVYIHRQTIGHTTHTSVGDSHTTQCGSSDLPHADCV